jgi:hypothetical protein
MNRILGMILAGVAGAGLSVSTFAASRPFSLPGCLQDQYGDQYQNLVLDHVHHVVTGTVKVQQCGSDSWTMVGSWVGRHGYTILELSVANNGGTSGCVPIYQLKGPYPVANWYYDFGIVRNQKFKYAECSTDPPTVPDSDVGGARGMKRPR